MSKVDEAWLQDVERRVAQVSQPGALDPFFGREVGALIEALRQERAQVAVLTEALQRMVDRFVTLDTDTDDPWWRSVLAALSATAGTEGERAGRVQKLEAAVAAAKEVISLGDFYSTAIFGKWLEALRDLDAEEASGGPGAQAEGGKG